MISMRLCAMQGILPNAMYFILSIIVCTVHESNVDVVVLQNKILG